MKPLATTRRLCPDEQRNRWDRDRHRVGKRRRSDAKRPAALNGSGHTLIYTLRDWVC
ncbi:hypothetical protein M8494_09335 [Serratia ureilytica]